MIGSASCSVKFFVMKQPDLGFCWEDWIVQEVGQYIVPASVFVFIVVYPGADDFSLFHRPPLLR